MWHKFFGEIEEFFEKRCQFSCQFWEKMTFGFLSNLVVSFG